MTVTDQLVILSHTGKSYPFQVETLTDVYGNIFKEIRKLLEAA